MTTIKTIHSELIKLKYPPILWLGAFFLISILTLVFSGYYIDVNQTVQLGVNPWNRLNVSTRAIFTIFMGIPFIVLLISAALNIEHQNHGFKQLYALPKSRGALLLSKLTALLLSFLFVTCLLILGNILIGYILNFIYPETEFSYFELPLLSLIKSYLYVLISFLGVIGIQFFLSLRFKGFLVPASIGILAYILGVILSSINHKFSVYFPYCHSTVARKNGIFDMETLGVDQHAILNQVEIYSIIIFVICILFSVYLERKRNI